MTTYINNTGGPPPPKGVHVALRLLPWTSEAGTPCYLSSTDTNGYLSQLADEVEASQTSAACEVLGAAKAVLNDKKAGYRETHFALARATESLGDILRIAQSRAERLPAPAYEPNQSPELVPDSEDGQETAAPPAHRLDLGLWRPNDAPPEHLET